MVAGNWERRYIGIILFVLGLVLTLSGCWNRREVETLAFVTAVAVDKAAEPGKIQLTVQVAKPPALVSQAPGGTSSERAFWLVSSTGYTVFEAVRNFLSQSPRRLYWAHNRWVLFGEDLAREGIEEVIDFFVRDGEARRTARVGIFKGEKASDLFQAEFELERLPSKGGFGITTVSRAGLSTVVDVDLNSFLQMLVGEGIEPVAIRAELVPRPPDTDIRGQLERKVVSVSARVTGAAVFKGDRLVGWLNKPETRGLNWVKGEVRSGIIVIKQPGAEDKFVGLELRRAGSKVKPEIKNGKPSVTVEVDAEAAVGDVQEFIDTVDASKVVPSMERRMATVIKNEIMAALEKAQGQFKSDIFGFGSAISKRFPREWQALKRDWNDTGFIQLDVQVKVKAKLRRSGLIKINPVVKK